MIKKVYLYIKNSREKEFCLVEIIQGIRIKYRNSVNQNVLTSEKGWILFDSLLGIIFLSTAIIALLLTFTQATKVNTAATNRVEATYLAQQALEDLKVQDGHVEKIILPPEYKSKKYTIKVDEVDKDLVPTITNTHDLSTYLTPCQVTVSWLDSTGVPTNKPVKMIGYYYVNKP